MITLRDFMETVNYRITEGGEYGWNCYGRNAYSLDSWDGDHDGHSVSIVFDTRTQTVYEMTANDYTKQRAYRLINPDYRKKYKAESKERDSDADQAWDNVNYVDLETDEDMLEKARAIVAGEDYDTRVSIPIELPDNELLVLFKMAHDRDMTFNDFIEEVLREKLESMQNDNV